MIIQLNGEPFTVAEGTETVADLVAALNLVSRIIVVEHNRTVLTRDDYPRVGLQDGDQVEIVQFVGGG
ncbi:sulfur carrier protein ThiS [Laceyella sacchari]|uniref:Sulfur carrier protein ThiS n=1 Tax=Laceyella sacchari TaxID=37482 RepID=A0ABY5TZG7_LACSH|nr:sulfur carrier protein ThiS [Laceyella sacchari]KPC74765.1 thiamine biosynthesis protein ThiS [Thermoactinomyces vulgaris]UWE02803.1 sulfur carrier protein ThiS [Laceyella sacchari]